jgi:hypothetical protein
VAKEVIKELWVWLPILFLIGSNWWEVASNNNMEEALTVAN